MTRVSRISVLKLNLSGVATRRYSGRLLGRAPHVVQLEAHWQAPDVDVLDVTLQAGDRFVETFFDDRWYNVFEIFDRHGDAFKGWYCNLSRPAMLGADTVSWVDLALDLWVWPDGRHAVLDEDEFLALRLESVERETVLQTLQWLRQRPWIQGETFGNWPEAPFSETDS